MLRSSCRAIRMAAAAALTGTLLSAVFVAAAAASSDKPGPGWELTAHSLPTNLPPGGTGIIAVNVFNIGAASSNGTVTVTDVLPPGMTATDAGLIRAGGESISHELWDCSGTTVVTCTSDPTAMPTLAGGGGGPRDDGGPLLSPQIGIAVAIAPSATKAEVNRVTVAGGGAQTSASTTEPITVSSTPAGFGIAGWDVWFSSADGTIDTQAGSHPYLATFNLDLNTDLNEFGGWHMAGGYVRNVEVNLPPGFIGDPNAVPQCSRELFDGGNEGTPKCPTDSQVGIVTTSYGSGVVSDRELVYNLVPRPGVPATFGFQLVGINGLLDGAVRTGSDYGITTHIDNIPERQIQGAVVTLWGVPADRSHDGWRRPGSCAENCLTSGGPLKPFLTLPTSCAGPQVFSVQAETWQHPGVKARANFLSHDANGAPTGFTGCEHLGFDPSITIAPDTAHADTPAGLTVEVKPPVGGLESPEGLSTADIQNTTVTLPEGLVINPGQAAGLQACQSSQDGVGTEQPPECPNASKVGIVSIATPLLPDKLEGNVYVLQANPPNLELLVAAAADGVNVKLVGKVHLDERTGRLTTTFSDTPELPFTDFKLSFSGGAQAALATPTGCGSYSTSSDFTPWSSPFTADVFPFSNFQIADGPGGGPCPPGPLPFAPTLTAGSTTDQAGGFTDFSLLLQRGDAQQRIERLQFKAPPGLSGMISQVRLCGEPQAAQGMCSAASQIGHATVASGPGPYPLVVPEPGRPAAAIYLTGPYQSAPFGLSIVTHVLAGPFDLGTIVTRAKIEVDPHTAQIAVTTDPLPQIVKGVPTNLRLINAVIDRSGFMFNPTNCNPSSFAGTAWGTLPPGAGGAGATAPISSPFQVGSCRSLKFTPDFKVATSGKTSKANGASLDVKVVYPSPPPGENRDNQASSQANIRGVKVELPKQLPSRLTTLQKACTAAQFNANPAGCPAASVIGHARVITPLLPVPLEGPAYFVSNGGEAFPNLIMVLQGYGVTVELVGDTFIKRGITSSTFKSTPDVPFNSFELTLPQGPHSALTANGSLCNMTRIVTVRRRVALLRHGHTVHVVRSVKRRVREQLTMPTTIVGQNGAQLKQNTKISISGCPGAKRPHTKRSIKGKRSK
jgi:uncharacterized repeat protein (TIGR01451 family)